MSSALGDVYISPELILMDIEAKTDQEAIEILAKHLYEKGIVKESYIDAVKREKRYLVPDLTSKKWVLPFRIQILSMLIGRLLQLEF